MTGIWGIIDVDHGGKYEARRSPTACVVFTSHRYLYTMTPVYPVSVLITHARGLNQYDHGPHCANTNVANKSRQHVRPTMWHPNLSHCCKRYISGTVAGRWLIISAITSYVVLPITKETNKPPKEPEKKHTYILVIIYAVYMCSSIVCILHLVSIVCRTCVFCEHIYIVAENVCWFTVPHI